MKRLLLALLISSSIYAQMPAIGSGSGGGGTGTVTGSGTAGDLAYWSGATALGTTGITKSGSDFTFPGNVLIGGTVLAGRSQVGSSVALPATSGIPGTIGAGYAISNPFGGTANALWLLNYDGAATNPQIVQVDTGATMGAPTTPTNNWGNSGIGTIVSAGYVAGSVAAVYPYTIFEYGSSGCNNRDPVAITDVQGKIQFGVVNQDAAVRPGLVISACAAGGGQRITSTNDTPFRAFHVGQLYTFSGENTTDFEYGQFGWGGSGNNTLNIGAVAGGTGTLRSVAFTGAGFSFANTITLSSGHLTLPNGSALAPAINFGDTSTGFVRNASNKVGISLNNGIGIQWEGATNGQQFASGFGIGFCSQTDLSSGTCTSDTSIQRASAAVLGITGALKPSVGYQSTDGTVGVTGATCSAWKNGLCVAN